VSRRGRWWSKKTDARRGKVTDVLSLNRGERDSRKRPEGKKEGGEGGAEEDGGSPGFSCDRTYLCRRRRGREGSFSTPE
jgi:hypothetical protein